MGVLQKLSEKFAVQTAVYWGPPEENGYGDKTFPEPREIKVRWDGEEMIVTDKYGNQFQQKAKVLVTEDLSFDGYLWLGSLLEMESGITSPLEVENAYPIRKITKVPMVKKTDDFFRTVYLSARV